MESGETVCLNRRPFLRPYKNVHDYTQRCFSRHRL